MSTNTILLPTHAVEPTTSLNKIMLKELSLTHRLLRIGQGSISFMYDGYNGFVGVSI